MLEWQGPSIGASPSLSVTAFVQPIYVVAVLREVLGEQHCLLWDIASLSTMIFVYLSLATMVILSVQSYLTLAYPYHCQNIVTMRRLKITVVCSSVCIVAATFAVKFNSPLQIYLTVLIISSTISIVVFTWIWTCRLVARHRKAIEATQNTFSSRNCIEKGDTWVDSYRFGSDFESSLLLPLWFVFYLL